MKYIKTYESIWSEDDRKKLSSFFVKFFTDLGYDFENYLNKGDLETIFFIDDKFRFRLIWDLVANIFV